jgi:hypothetical protein
MLAYPLNGRRWWTDRPVLTLFVKGISFRHCKYYRRSVICLCRGWGLLWTLGWSISTESLWSPENILNLRGTYRVLSLSSPVFSCWHEVERLLVFVLHLVLLLLVVLIVLVVQYSNNKGTPSTAELERRWIERGRTESDTPSLEPSYETGDTPGSQTVEISRSEAGLSGRCLTPHL